MIEGGSIRGLVRRDPTGGHQGKDGGGLDTKYGYFDKKFPAERHPAEDYGSDPKDWIVPSRTRPAEEVTLDMLCPPPEPSSMKPSLAPPEEHEEVKKFAKEEPVDTYTATHEVMRSFIGKNRQRAEDVAEAQNNWVAEHYGVNSEKYAVSVFNHAKVLESQQKYQEALPLFEEALNIMKGVRSGTGVYGETGDVDKTAEDKSGDEVKVALHEYERMVKWCRMMNHRMPVPPSKGYTIMSAAFE